MESGPGSVTVHATQTSTSAPLTTRVICGRPARLDTLESSGAQVSSVQGGNRVHAPGLASVQVGTRAAFPRVHPFSSVASSCNGSMNEEVAMDTSDIVGIARPAGLTMGAGALVLTGFAVAEIADPLTPGQPGFAFRSTAVAIGQLLLLIGLVGLWRSGAAGRGRLGRAGLGTAVAALGVLVAAELVIRVRPDLAEPMFAVAEPLLGVGMVLAGIAVVRARRWFGWRRFAPLGCGLYVLVIVLPVFALSGGPNFVAITGQNLCWLALGVGLWTVTSAAAGRTVVSGAAPKKATR